MKSDPLRTLQVTIFQSQKAWYMQKPESVLENETHKNPSGLRVKQIVQSMPEDRI